MAFASTVLFSLSPPLPSPLPYVGRVTCYHSANSYRVTTPLPTPKFQLGIPCLSALQPFNFFTPDSSSNPAKTSSLKIRAIRAIRGSQLFLFLLF